ncbi:MAG: recombinase family protein [Clostridia bacterium]|nr:recombinase family protein [Clostridia bacterium]
MDRIIEKVHFDMPVQPKATRVAAYARVSSGKDAMLHSLSAQISYYSEMIQSRLGWLYAGVYSDEALTGTKENRRGFQALLEDCRAGKIDMVIVKSISRLARNTVTLLETVRELRTYDVDVYFEEQNIHTLSSEGELMLTILASYAQEESLSVSENQKWRIQKNFKEGKPWNGAMLGYRNVNGTLTVIPEEAELVKRIFDMYLSGMGIQSIANTLNREGVPTRLGAKFKYTGIHKMLRNEAYAGNLLLQKTFKDNHITKRTIINRGELPMYYVENAHEPIIPPETFKRVQDMIAQRAEKYAPPATDIPLTYRFTSLITCAKCGKHFRRKLVRGKPVWICPTFNYEGKAACPAKQIPEEILEEITADMDMERFTGITADDGNRLLFHFSDGTTAEKIWRDRSRSESWTDEMRQNARAHTKARNQKK